MSRQFFFQCYTPFTFKVRNTYLYNQEVSTGSVLVSLKRYRFDIVDCVGVGGDRVRSQPARGGGGRESVHQVQRKRQPSTPDRGVDSRGQTGLPPERTGSQATQGGC